MLSITASCDQSATGTLTGTVKALIKKNGRRRRRTFPLPVVHMSLTAGGSVLVAVRLPAPTVKALKAKAKEALTLQLTVSNVNGTTTVTAGVANLRGVR
jgi:hypothetical protein